MRLGLGDAAVLAEDVAHGPLAKGLDLTVAQGSFRREENSWKFDWVTYLRCPIQSLQALIIKPKKKGYFVLLKLLCFLTGKINQTHCQAPCLWRRTCLPAWERQTVAQWGSWRSLPPVRPWRVSPSCRQGRGQCRLKGKWWFPCAQLRILYQ